MNKYESIIIIRPNENKEEINRTLDKFKKQIESSSNKNVNMEDLGEKRLAYEIQGNQKEYHIAADGTETLFQTRSYIKVK